MAALIRMVLRKMVKNKWLEMGLLIGIVLFVALVCSIPMYTNGILQKMLVKELEQHQLEKGIYTGNVKVTSDYGFYTGGRPSQEKVYKNVDRYIKETFLKKVGLPINIMVEQHDTGFWYTREDLREREVPRRKPGFNVGMLSDLDDHVEIIDGRLPSSEKVDGKYEVMVTEITMKRLDLMVGDEFILENTVIDELQEVPVKIVGVFTPDTEKEPLYWFNSFSAYEGHLFINDELYRQDFLSNFYVNKTYWYMGLDYHSIHFKELNQVYNAYKELNAEMKTRGFGIEMPALNIMERYERQKSQLIILLLTLYVPVTIMLIFYLFMVSNLTVARQENEIAVLRSRGAGRWQIIYSFLLESMILGGIGLLAGPRLGSLFCRILGSTTNFMEFVQRKAMPIQIDMETYQYAIVAVVLSIVTMLVPAYIATGYDIIEHKRKIGSGKVTHLWKKYFLDIVLLGISFYGLYRFNERQADMAKIGVSAESLHIDPLLFIVSILFILGLGLLFLRIYPYLVEGVYRLGRRIWPPTAYASLIQVARAGHTYQYLMIFIIMTIGVGLFSATAARTINQNAEDKIRYQVGADVTMMAQWGSNAPPPQYDDMGNVIPTNVTGIRYEEPPYQIYGELKGVESTARVFSGVAQFFKGKPIEAKLMGIDIKEFAETAWYPGGVLPFHWYEYLNALGVRRNGVLISRSLAEALEVYIGADLQMNWARQGSSEWLGRLNMTVCGILDYWPTWNPNLENNPSNNQYKNLVVANLGFLYDAVPIQPYEVWLKLKPDARTQDLYNDMMEKELVNVYTINAEQELIKLRNDPYQLGINGALTLGFIVSLMVSLAGFIIYWILSIHARFFQAGIMMAMGLKLRQLMQMMVWEQIMTSIAPMLLGIVTGGIASRLFVPIFQITYSAAEQVPPFKVIAYLSDYLKVYATLGIMLVLGLSSITYMLSRLEVYKVIKLGEDS